MSTRSSIWLGQSEGKTVHLYWELGERESGTAPVYISVDDGDSKFEAKARLPKQTAEILLSVLCPDYKTRFGTDVI